MSEQLVAISSEQLKELIGAVQGGQAATLEKVLDRMDEKLKHTPGSTTPAAGGMLHGYLADGSGNLAVLAGAGVRPEMWSAMSRPFTFLDALGAPKKSMLANEIVEIQTGVTAASGSNTNSWCGDPPDVTGDLKVCRIAKAWGEYYGKSKLQIIPEMGEIATYADVPRNIINIGPAGHPFFPDIMFNLDNTQSRLQYTLWSMGQGMELTLERVAVQGSTALAYTATQLGYMSEFDGLDRWIKTGYTDSVAGVTCPAADSLVLDFGTSLGNTIAGESQARYINDAVMQLIWGLTQRAARNRVENFQLALVMRQELFYKLVDHIACNYSSSGCSLSESNAELAVMSTDYINWRDGMLNGQYILVRGMKYPVLFSDGVDLEGIGQDQFRTDIYAIPLLGKGRQLTYVQYFPMDNAVISEFEGFPDGATAVPINNGLWLFSEERTSFCKEFHVAGRMRLIIETPFLAGRIDNIEFTYDTDLTHDPYYGESMYVDGGVSYR